MRAAVIDGGVVVNVIELPDDWDAADETAWQPPDGHQVVEIGADVSVGPGWTHSGSGFQAPTVPEPVPPEPEAPATPTPDELQAQIDELTDMILELP